MRHPLSNQRPQNPQFVQHSQSSYHHRQQSPPKKQKMQSNNQYPRREEAESNTYESNTYHGAHQSQHRSQVSHNQQKSGAKEPNSFVPLQALKKQRNRSRREPKENTTAQQSTGATEQGSLKDSTKEEVS